MGFGLRSFLCYNEVINTRYFFCMTLPSQSMSNGPENPDLAKLGSFKSPEISGLEADELALERTTEIEKPILEAEKEHIGSVPTTHTTSSVATQDQVQALEKDQVTIEVEQILEKDLAEIYDSLPEDVKPVFKKKGEQTALAITDMVKRATVKMSEVMKLVMDWLKIIPGVNRFYLEQEAKIKSDHIVTLSEQIKKDRLTQ